MGSSDPLAWRSGRACHSVRAVPATFFFAWFAWFAVHLNSLSASAGERDGERCRSNEFALIGAIRVKVFVFISSFSSLLAFVFSAFFTVKSPPSVIRVIRVIRVKVFVFIVGSSDPLAWRGGRACHSVRAVPATFFCVVRGSSQLPLRLSLLPG